MLQSGCCDEAGGGSLLALFTALGGIFGDVFPVDIANSLPQQLKSQFHNFFDLPNVQIRNRHRAFRT